MNKPFHTITVDGEDYRLCFSSKDVIDLEEKLGVGLMSAFSDQNRLMKVGTQVTMLHAALQKYQHGTKMADACALYDDIMREANGDGMMVVMNALMGAMQASGFMPPSEDSQDKEPKTAKKKKKTNEDNIIGMTD